MRHSNHSPRIILHSGSEHGELFMLRGRRLMHELYRIIYSTAQLTCHRTSFTPAYREGINSSVHGTASFIVGWANWGRSITALGRQSARLWACRFSRTCSALHSILGLPHGRVCCRSSRRLPTTGTSPRNYVKFVMNVQRRATGRAAREYGTPCRGVLDFRLGMS